MCGIAGFFYRDKTRPPDPAIIEKMTAQLCHRGPDDEAFYIQPGIALGFRRLSIIDLAGGRQPLVADDGMSATACNGEIYNWRELRAELEKRGAVFHSNCDTETVLHAYREYGAGFVEKLNGQFAYAVYDRREHALILGRDQAGIAPMFYALHDDAVIFASEIKAILAYPGISREVDITALDQLLTFPGIVSPRTMFKHVSSVRPGHYNVFTGSDVRDVEYWDLVYPEQDAGGLDETAAATRLEQALLQAVEYRLQADVPVGFYLSGGLDSSLVGAMIHSLAPEIRRHSFSIGFTNTEIDERRFQRIMTQQTGSLHHEVEFDPLDVERMMPHVVRLTECPLKETYDVCSLILSGLVKQHGLKVVQTGEGADELFAGYIGYRLDGNRTASALDGVEAMLEADIRARLWGDSSFIYERDFIPLREIKEALYHPELAEALPQFECINEPLLDPARIKGRHPSHKRSYIDFKLRLADHLLSDHGDRMAYGNSIEARYPFLDTGVIDAARAIPPELLVHNGSEKYILRRVADKYLPVDIMRREKFSFVAPASPQLMQHNIDWVNATLDSDAIRKQGFFNHETVERLKTMYASDGFSLNQTFDNDLLMIVMTFGLFLQEFNIPDR